MSEFVWRLAMIEIAVTVFPKAVGACRLEHRVQGFFYMPFPVQRINR